MKIQVHIKNINNKFKNILKWKPMSEFQIKNIKEIDLGYGNLINHFAFDGCSYYFTVTGESKVLKTDKNFMVQDVYYTCREYDCICYDSKDC